MHLLIVNQYGLPAGVPGITRHGDLGRELVRRGHRVTVIASRFNYLTRDAGAGDAVEDRDGVTFRWLRTGSYTSNDRRRVRSMVDFTLRATAAGLRLRPAPDVVIGSSPHLLAGAAALALSYRYRVPFLFEVRDLWPSVLVDLGAIRTGGLAHRALTGLEAMLYRGARHIITVPPHADDRVVEVGGDRAKCVHIPNATTLETAAGSPLPASLEAILSAEAGRFVVMYTGAHGVSNGLDTVIRAASHLRSNDPDTYDRVAFVLVGGGTERERLMAAARAAGHEHLHFHPSIEKPAIPTALGRADALLVNFADAPVYRYGLSPNKLFDYMAAGRPILLSTRLTDTAVDAHGTGMTFEPGSGASLGDAIRSLALRPQAELNAMGECGRRAVLEHFTIEATATQLEQLLRDVVRRAS